MSHTSTPIVFVVDPDPSVRESLELLVRAAGWRAETFCICARIPRLSAICWSFLSHHGRNSSGPQWS